MMGFCFLQSQVMMRVMGLVVVLLFISILKIEVYPEIAPGKSGFKIYIQKIKTT
jgi:hypothetical protein